jgi:hypothetical protein
VSSGCVRQCMAVQNLRQQHRPNSNSRNENLLAIAQLKEAISRESTERIRGVFDLSSPVIDRHNWQGTGVRAGLCAAVRLHAERGEGKGRGRSREHTGRQGSGAHEPWAQ